MTTGIAQNPPAVQVAEGVCYAPTSVFLCRGRIAQKPPIVHGWNVPSAGLCHYEARPFRPSLAPLKTSVKVPAGKNLPIVGRLGAKMENPGSLSDSASGPVDPLDQAARIADIKERLGRCLDELDQMNLWDVGAHLSMAITTLERHSAPAQPSITE